MSRFLVYMQFSMYNINVAKAVFSQRENHVERNGLDQRSRDFLCLLCILRTKSQTAYLLQSKSEEVSTFLNHYKFVSV